MAKKQFKAESKRLLDMMINSIYTHKEIFLRELISNASDAIDKLAYLSLTDEKVGMSRSDFAIWLTLDKEGRTITIEDNGIGMTREELETNLGTIAKSGSLKFKQELAQTEGDKGDVDVIGQFGVGFYSAFMVADKVTVISKAYGSDTAYKWESEGVDGYTIEPCEKETVGTDIIMSIKENSEEAEYSDYLRPYFLSDLIKKYSDYIRYPIRMEIERSQQKPKPADAGGAQDDALLALAGCNCLGGSSGKLRIVAGCCGMSAEVHYFVAILFQMLDHLVLQGQCAVITADRNFHL